MSEMEILRKKWSCITMHKCNEILILDILVLSQFSGGKHHVAGIQKNVLTCSLYGWYLSNYFP